MAKKVDFGQKRTERHKGSRSGAGGKNPQESRFLLQFICNERKKISHGTSFET